MSQLSKKQICIIVLNQWIRIYSSSKLLLTQKIIDLIINFFYENDMMNIKELFVTIGIVGDDTSDKLGLIYNYINDYYMELHDENKLRLIKENECDILKFNKRVKLSSRICVNISISCLSQLQKHKLPEICQLGTKSIIFTYDLCSISSLQSIKKWYKDCYKINNLFIPILVGTNFKDFKNKERNDRIFMIEQSRKYARKMKAILIFISSEYKQQINIKEIFLIILSKIYHFDSNIQPISNEKLPIIEFYDDYIHDNEIYNNYKNNNNQQRHHYNTMKVTRKHVNKYKHIQQQPYNNNNNNDNHQRTRTSIQDIQNRLSVIRSNLRNKNNNINILNNNNNNINNNPYNNNNNNKRIISHTNNKSDVEQLYDKFEKEYQSFMIKQIGTDSPLSPTQMNTQGPISPVSTESASVTPSQINDTTNNVYNNSKNNNNATMYPSFLHYSQNNNKSKSHPSTETKETRHTENKTLEDLLKDDALGLTTLDTEKEEHDDNDNDNDNNSQQIDRKKQKHERAMSMIPSLLNRARTFPHDADDIHGNGNNFKHQPRLDINYNNVYFQNKSKQNRHHNRAMPSMPNFLSKLQHDNQLKNIITNVFSQTNSHHQQVPYGRHHHVRGRTVGINTMPTIPVPIPKFIPQSKSHPMNGKKHGKKNGNNNNNKKVKLLQRKISNLEETLNSYQNIMKENTETVAILKKTISKIQAQRDQATKTINLLEKENKNIANNQEIIKLKNKNLELQSLADALAMNLARKEQSLEEALNAIHVLNEEKDDLDQETEGIDDDGGNYSHNNSKSLTEGEILSLSHSIQAIDDEDSNDDDSNDSNDSIINNKKDGSFRKGIARRLRSLSNSLTQLKNLDTKSTK